MIAVNEKTRARCQSFRLRVLEAIHDQLDISNGWMRRHVAECPRCRRLLRGVRRLDVAMLMVKSQPHRMNLLARANRGAIAVLNFKLRNLPQADTLRVAQPRPTLLQRFRRYSQALTHAAACLAFLLLLRMGIFNSMRDFHDQSARAVDNYYNRVFDETDHA
ncbi:MAG: hypothetical protein JXA11_06715 [Phycisphaerae bacterium]|nr:hypothetical protein [Phycisphaerae bacterium]